LTRRLQFDTLTTTMIEDGGSGSGGNDNNDDDDGATMSGATRGLPQV
jgi:hypothetical protein